MAMRMVSAVLALGALLPASVLAASFDCNKASSAVEQRLCGNDTLGSLDERVDEAWKAFIAEAPRAHVAEQLATQRAWLKQRNACMQQGDADACLAQQMQARAKQLDAALPAERKALDALIARIPAEPKAAAQALTAYNGPLASAWLVYLQQFVPEAGVDAVTAKARAQSARKALAAADDFSSQLLEDAFNDPKAKPGAAQLMLLRMWIERLYGDSDRPYNHCFLFARHGELAYDAFGPLYGSTRDSFAPICAPQGDLFEQSAWKALRKAIEPALDDIGMNHGTIRFASFAMWRVIALRATVSPLLYLDPERLRYYEGDPVAVINAWAPMGDGSEEGVPQAQADAAWSRAQRAQAIAVLPQVRQQTSDWLIRERSISPEQAATIADRLVRIWVLAHLEVD